MASLTIIHDNNKTFFICRFNVGVDQEAYTSKVLMIILGFHLKSNGIVSTSHEFGHNRSQPTLHYKNVSITCYS